MDLRVSCYTTQTTLPPNLPTNSYEDYKGIDMVSFFRELDLTELQTDAIKETVKIVESMRGSLKDAGYAGMDHPGFSVFHAKINLLAAGFTRKNANTLIHVLFVMIKNDMTERRPSYFGTSLLAKKIRNFLDKKIISLKDQKKSFETPVVQIDLSDFSEKFLAIAHECSVVEEEISQLKCSNEDTSKAIYFLRNSFYRIEKSTVIEIISFIGKHPSREWVLDEALWLILNKSPFHSDVDVLKKIAQMFGSTPQKNLRNFIFLFKTVLRYINAGAFGRDKDVLFEFAKSVFSLLPETIFLFPDCRQFLASLVINGKFGNSREVLELIVCKLPSLNLNNQKIQNVLFNHLYYDGKSIFTLILNSKSLFKEEKLKAMNILFSHINNKIEKLHIRLDPFFDIIFNNEDVLEFILNNDKKDVPNEIINFINKAIPDYFLKKYENGFMEDNKNIVKYLMSHFFNEEGNILKYQSVFNQVKYYYFKEEKDPKKCEKIKRKMIFQSYMERLLPDEFKKWFLMDVVGVEFKDCSDSEIKFTVNSSLFTDYYFLVSKDRKLLGAFDQDYFEGIVNRREPQGGFARFYLFDLEKCKEQELWSSMKPIDETVNTEYGSTLGALLSQFPLIPIIYDGMETNSNHFRFFEALKLEEYHEKFYRSIFSRGISEISGKLVDLEGEPPLHQTRLAEIFGQFLTGDEPLTRGVTEEFLEKIYLSYAYQEKSNLDKAKLLTLVAAMFSRLSSAVFFGVGSDSPQILRDIAVGLVNAADQCDPEHQFLSDSCLAKWKNILTGLNNPVSTCTALLSSDMIETLHADPIFKLFPVAWK